MSKVIIFPTDTVYGIGTPIFDIEGIKRIYDIKHRDLTKPLACLCSSLNQIDSIAILNEDSRKIINKLMPGALTIILKSKDNVRKSIGYDTIAVRIPDSKIAIDILNENGPMLTTSVNESGEKPLNTYIEIKDVYNNLVDYIYDSNIKSSSIPSTIISIIGNDIKVIREGEVTKDMILNVLK